MIYPPVPPLKEIFGQRVCVRVCVKHLSNILSLEVLDRFYIYYFCKILTQILCKDTMFKLHGHGSLFVVYKRGPSDLFLFWVLTETLGKPLTLYTYQKHLSTSIDCMDLHSYTDYPPTRTPTF